MERFVILANIERYQRMLDDSALEAQMRRSIERILREEKAKLQEWLRSQTGGN